MIEAKLILPEESIAQIKVSFTLELTLEECETIEKEIEGMEGRSEVIDSIRTALHELRKKTDKLISRVKFKN